MTAALTLDIPSHPIVDVITTNGRGFTPEEVAQRCVDRIVSISDSAHPALQAQAHAFKASIHKLVTQYMREAIQSDRTTVYNALVDAGRPELAELVRRL